MKPFNGKIRLIGDFVPLETRTHFVDEKTGRLACVDSAKCPLCEMGVPRRELRRRQDEKPRDKELKP